MNAAILIIIALLWFVVGYRFYSRFIAKKIRINDKNKTPSTGREDSDYSSSNSFLLMGHHFASIAGAGPIIGPILAVSYFGWGPVVLWVLLGAVFIGAVHDYVSLISSSRNKGEGVSNITKKYLNSRAGFIFGLMIWLTLVLIITVFGVSAANSIIQEPSLVIPLATITILALIMGIGVKKKNWNLKKATIIAILLIFFSVYIGHIFPIILPIQDPVILRAIWITIIFVYGFVASTIPVWTLLRPRDYLSAIQMGLILLLGIVAIIIARPIINAPIYIANGPFPLWPILFITVACGAISGFHGLVSSGTTSKQLAKESHGRKVAYLSMLGEGLLAVVVTIVVISGLSWGGGGFESFYATLDKGWIIAFATGFGNIVSQLSIPGITMGIAALLGAFMINQFILTSVDTSTRIGRLVISENLFPKLKNRYLTALITLVPAYLLAITNTYEDLWRLFGSSNQLIAAITLIGISAYFVQKKIDIKMIMIPALFVLVTTLSALIYLSFFSGGYLFQGNYILTGISVLMFLFGLTVAYEGFRQIFLKKKT